MMNKIHYIIICLLLCACLVKAEERLYNINELFTIKVSDKLEPRNTDDSDTKFIEDTLNYFSNKEIVFQQKGLSIKSATALDYYCRILIQTNLGGNGDYPCCYDDNFSEVDIEEYKSLAKNELGLG